MSTLEGQIGRGLGCLPSFLVVTNIPEVWPPRQVGGAKPAAKAAETYLKMLGRHVIYCGQQGNGQAAKVASPLARLFLCAVIRERATAALSPHCSTYDVVLACQVGLLYENQKNKF